MLLREQGDAVLAIGQASHAWISGQLARAWGNQRFPTPEPREEVCLGAEQHDIGMAEWDLRPTLNRETGLPHSFIELPVETHIGLWAAAPNKLLSQSRYAALLVSMHGTALQARRNLASLSAADRRLVTRYLDDQHSLQATLAQALGADSEQLARGQRLLWAWDGISLAVCLRWPSLELSGIPDTAGAGTMMLAPAGADRFTIDPWPFAAERLEVRCDGRLLEGRFDSERQLHAALDRAPGVGLTLTLAPR